MPRKINGKIYGEVECRECGVRFCAKTATKFCTEDCHISNLNKRGKDKHQESFGAKKERLKRYREDHKKNGLCKDCSEPTEGVSRCKKHQKMQAESDRRRKAKKNYGHLWKEKVELLEINDTIKEIENDAKELIS